MIYQIRVKGVLDKTWSNWLGNVDICAEHSAKDGLVTTMTVELMDQAALFGILDHIRDMNLTLISVNRQGEDAVWDQ